MLHFVTEVCNIFKPLEYASVFLRGHIEAQFAGLMNVLLMHRGHCL